MAAFERTRTLFRSIAVPNACVAVLLKHDLRIFLLTFIIDYTYIIGVAESSNFLGVYPMKRRPSVQQPEHFCQPHSDSWGTSLVGPLASYVHQARAEIMLLEVQVVGAWQNFTRAYALGRSAIPCLATIQHGMARRRIWSDHEYLLSETNDSLIDREQPA